MDRQGGLGLHCVNQVTNKVPETFIKIRGPFRKSHNNHKDGEAFEEERGTHLHSEKSGGQPMESGREAVESLMLRVR